MNNEERIPEKNLKQELKKQALKETKALEFWIEKQLEDWEKYIDKHHFIFGDVNKIKRSFFERIEKKYRSLIQ